MLSAALSLSPVAAGATPASPATASTPARPATATTAVSTTVDFSGDGHADLIARTPTGVLYLYRGNGAGGFLGPRTVLGTGWQIYDRLFSPGDFTGDRHPDLLARVKGGALYLYKGNGAGGFLGSRTLIGTGWNMFDKVFGLGDFSGDGKADLMGRTPAGYLYLYRGNGAGGFLSRTVIGTGWTVFNLVGGVG
ncbi:MAG: FG-GAP repeat domain-containing protein [Oryzihumus sp.]